MAGPAPEPYESYIRDAASRYGVPVALLREQLRAESGFNPNARSPAGAQGIAQFMPATAAGLGVDPWNPVSAVDGAARLMARYLKDYGGSVEKALAAYNAGPGAVQRYGGVPPYRETQDYVSRIVAAAGVGATVDTADFSLPNPLDVPGDVAGAVVGKLTDMVWSVGRPVLLTGALVAAGGVVVALGLWRAVQQQSRSVRGG